MTLSNVFGKQKTQAILDVMPDVTSVWKVVLMNPKERCYVAPYVGCKYGSGRIEAHLYDSHVSQNCDYDLFFHFWVQKHYVLEKLNIWLESRARILEDLDDEINPDIRIMHNPMKGFNSPLVSPVQFEAFINVPRVISCVICKDWISAIGKNDDGLAVVCKYAIFPEYPKISPDPRLHFCVVDLPVTSTIETTPEIEMRMVGRPDPMEESLSVQYARV